MALSITLNGSRSPLFSPANLPWFKMPASVHVCLLIHSLLWLQLGYEFSNSIIESVSIWLQPSSKYWFWGDVRWSTPSRLQLESFDMMELTFSRHLLFITLDVLLQTTATHSMSASCKDARNPRSFCPESSPLQPTALQPSTCSALTTAGSQFSSR